MVFVKPFLLIILLLMFFNGSYAQNVDANQWLNQINQIKSAPLVKYNGSMMLSAQRSTAPVASLVNPPNFYRWQLNSVLSLKGLPIGVNGFWTTEQNPLRQNMNFFSVSFDQRTSRLNINEKVDQRLNDMESELMQQMDPNSLKSKEQDLMGKLNKAQLLNIDEYTNKLDKNKDSLNKLNSGQEKLNQKLAETREKQRKVMERKKSERNLEKIEQYKSKIQNIKSKIEQTKQLQSQMANQQVQLMDSLNNQLKIKEKLTQRLDSVKSSQEANYANASAETKAKLKKVRELKKMNPKERQDHVGTLDSMGVLKKVERIMLNVRSFSVGTSFPVFSEYTVNGIPLTGLNVEYTPKKWYFAGVGAKNLNPIEQQQPLNNNIPNTPGTPMMAMATPNTYARQVYAVAIGRGVPKKPHIHFNVMYGLDDQHSIRERKSADTVLTTGNIVSRPQENLVIGTDFLYKLPLAFYNIKVEGEVASSILSNDTRVARLNREKLQDFGLKTNDVNSQFQGDIAVMMKPIWTIDSLTELKGTYNRVGATYRSFGVPFLRRDFKLARLDFSRFFWKRKIFTQFYVFEDETNLSRMQPVTVFNRGGGLNAAIDIPKAPKIILSYLMMNFSQSPADLQTASIAAVQHNTSLTLNYPYQVGELGFQSLLNVMYQRKIAVNPILSFNIYGFDVQQECTLPIGLSVGLKAGLMKEESLVRNTTIQTVGIVGRFELGEKWRNSLGYDYLTNPTAGRRMIAFGESIYAFTKYLSANIRCEWNAYQLNGAPEAFTATTGLAGISINW
jgi:hypothetical protein